MFDSDQMEMLKNSFRTEVFELLTELETVLMDMEATPNDSDLTNRAFRALHSIKGSGTMFGFDEMSDFVHEIENIFDRIRKGELEISQQLIDLTLQAKDELSAMLNRSGTDTTPRRATTEPILAGYRRLVTGGSSVSDADETRLSSRTTTTSTASEKTYQIMFSPNADMLRKGSDPLLLLSELSGLGQCQVTVDTSRVPPLSEIQVDECYLSWGITLTTEQGRERIEEVFVFVADESGLDIREITPVPGDDLINVAPGPFPETTLGQTRVEQVAGIPATIRVPSERLDSLVDLVGELVTIQARLSGHVVDHGDATFLSIAETIERLTNELRDNAMSLRMVPVRATFSKLRRLVRDLSQQLGKDVEFETSGEDTELDKTVIENLGDPLMHIIRNSMDHGIESPEERNTAGKHPTGTIHLSASHEGASVAVTVSDDGKGLDIEKIRRTAIERGVITPDTDLSDTEAMKLIFAPGFSTAEKVTGVSGRGVGMDVVRRILDGLGGTVETTSTHGSGTSVTLRMPLTLAIIDGLLVTLGDQHYVIPLGSVRELLEFDRLGARSSGKRRLVENRGTLLPYVDLHEVFDSGCTAPDWGRIVVVDLRGTQVGIVVDEVVGQQQTVIKSLGSLPARTEGVSGATILGNGSVALILDVPRLIRDTETNEDELQVRAV